MFLISLIKEFHIRVSFLKFLDIDEKYLQNICNLSVSHLQQVVDVGTTMETFYIECLENCPLWSQNWKYWNYEMEIHNTIRKSSFEYWQKKLEFSSCKTSWSFLSSDLSFLYKAAVPQPQLGYVDLCGWIWNMGRESLKYDMSMMILCLIIRQEHYMIWLDNWIIIWIFYAFLGKLQVCNIYLSIMLVYLVFSKYILL